MKYLLLLIICISLFIKGNQSFPFHDIDQLTDDAYESDEGFEHHRCFGKDFEGYYTEFALSSFNTYYPTPMGILPVSFYEGGVIDVSFKKQMMYVHFGIVAKKQDNSSLVLAGQLYTFGQNNTQYVKMNGSDTCYASKLQFPFPSTLPKLKKVGETQLGQTKVDVVIYKNNNMTGYNYTRQCSLLEKGTCIPMSTNAGNADKTELGFSLMNFYKYEDKPKYEKIQIPPECYGVEPQDHQDHPRTWYNDLETPSANDNEEGEDYDENDETQFFPNEEKDQENEEEDNEEQANQDEEENQFGIHKNTDFVNNNHDHRRHHPGHRRPHPHHRPHHRRPFNPHHGHRRPHPHHGPHHPHHGPYHPHHHHPYNPHGDEKYYYPYVAHLVLAH